MKLQKGAKRLGALGAPSFHRFENQHAVVHDPVVGGADVDLAILASTERWGTAQYGGVVLPLPIDFTLRTDPAELTNPRTLLAAHRARHLALHFAVRTQTFHHALRGQSIQSCSVLSQI